MNYHFTRLSFTDSFHVYVANIGQSVDSCVLQIENGKEQLRTEEMQCA